jgi:hypothetical protein
MRVRDIVRASFDRVIEAGILPPYEWRGRFVPPPVRHNPTWRTEQVELIHYAGLDTGLYADLDAWRRAVAFIRAFTAGSAGRGGLPWRIAGWGGSFGEVPAPDVLQHVTLALGACGLRALPPNPITYTGYFEASDSPAISALPEPYGRWLQVREGQPRWNDKVELRLAARVRARVALRPDGRFDGFADLDLSAPAIALIDLAATAMGRPLPQRAGAALLDLDRAVLFTPRRR